MALYFFEIDHDGTTADPDGVELPDAEAARREAIRTLGEMVKGAAVHGPLQSIGVRIRDDRGQLITACSATVTTFD